MLNQRKLISIEPEKYEYLPLKELSKAYLQYTIKIKPKYKKDFREWCLTEIHQNN